MMTSFFIRQGIGLRNINDEIIPVIQVPERIGYLNIFLHRQPGDDDLPVISLRHIHDLLYPVNIRREGRNDDPAVC